MIPISANLPSRWNPIIAPSSQAADDPRRVRNIVDPDAWIPIAAHKLYGTKKLLRKMAYDQL